MELPTHLQPSAPARYAYSVSPPSSLEHLAQGFPALQDWAQFVHFEPALYVKPGDLDELKEFLTLMKQGALRQHRVRTPGSLHSCSHICESDAILDVSALPKTLEFSADNTTVTVSTNWHLHDFLLELSKHGKSLPATGGTDAQTLAGLISTNTAPATSKFAIYDNLEWLEYVAFDGDGKSFMEKRIFRGDPTFPSVVCSLGAIGILTKAQFRLVDEPFFDTLQKVLPINDVLDDIERTSTQYDFWRIDWIPNTDHGLFWGAKPIQRDQAVPDGDYPNDQAANLLEAVLVFYDDFKKGNAGPLLDSFMQMTYFILARIYGETRATGPLRNMLPVDRRAPLHVAMAEWSFKPSDLKRVLTECREYFQQHRWPNFPIEIELSKTDDYSMSAWNWEGLEYVVKFNFMYLTDICKTAEERGLIYTHLKGLWEHFTHVGIPFKAHWGKINFMDHAFVRTHYQLETFQKLIDPMFLNDYLAQRLLAPLTH